MLSFTGECSQGTDFPGYPGKRRDFSVHFEEHDPIPDLCSFLSDGSPIKFRRRFLLGTGPSRPFRLEFSDPKIAVLRKLQSVAGERNVDPVDTRALSNPKMAERRCARREVWPAPLPSQERTIKDFLRTFTRKPRP